MENINLQPVQIYISDIGKIYAYANGAFIELETVKLKNKQNTTTIMDNNGIRIIQN